MDREVDGPPPRKEAPFQHGVNAPCERVVVRLRIRSQKSTEAASEHTFRGSGSPQPNGPSSPLPGA